MPHVLLIEPDAPSASTITAVLTGAGYRVRSVASAAEAHIAIDDRRPDCVVLELALPDLDGLILISSLAEHNADVPLIVMSWRASQADVVLALKLGADDFLTKPVDAIELLARLDRVLARATHTRPTLTADARIVRAGGVTVDPARGTITIRDRDVTATPTEFRILALLIERAGTVLSRVAIAEAVWGVAPTTIDIGLYHNVDVHVGRIRRKLAAAGAGRSIETVRGSGYRMMLPEPEP